VTPNWRLALEELANYVLEIDLSNHLVCETEEAAQVSFYEGDEGFFLDETSWRICALDSEVRDFGVV